jgi:small conductance mechanosensitive channel
MFVSGHPRPGAAKRTSGDIMHDLRIGEQDIVHAVSPDSFLGAILYLLVFIVVAVLLSRGLRLALHSALAAHGHIDRTATNFLARLGAAVIWVIMLILYAHLIPVLRAMGTALLAGASVASVVIGLAAQSTLGNLIAGIAITIYRPFQLGDTLQVSAPTGAEIGSVEQISLGYTTLRTPDGRRVVLPNSVAASQIAINLGGASTPAPLTIAIRVSRKVDLEAARREALRTAQQAVEESRVLGAFLTRIEATAAVIELRVRAPDAADRDALRSKLVAALAQNFANSGLDAEGADRASFA